MEVVEWSKFITEGGEWKPGGGSEKTYQYKKGGIKK